MTWLWIIVAFIAGAIIAHWLTRRACEEEHRSIEGSTSRIASMQIWSLPPRRNHRL